MPNPKRQHSTQRQRKRRTHFKVEAPSLAVCSQCKKEIKPHRVCPFCGFYKGKPVLVVEEEKSDKKETK